MHNIRLFIPLTLLIIVSNLQGQVSAPVAASAGPPPASGRRIALVIGNNLYIHTPLLNAVNDATAMGAALSDAGYAVTMATNTSLAQLEAAIGAFINSAQTGDIALVYYAGHGFQIDGENYFVPTDFSASDPSTAKTRAVAMSRITDGLRQQNVHDGILIADACRDNPFNSTRSMLPGLAAMSSGAGMLISLATYPGGRASDNPNQGHGLYTKALLDNLKRPGLSIDQLFSGVAAQVSRESNGAQIPWTGSALRGVTPFGSTGLLSATAVKTPPVTNTVTLSRSADSLPAPTVPVPASQASIPSNFLMTPNMARSQIPGIDHPQDDNILPDIAVQVRQGNVQQAQRGLDMLTIQNPTDFHVALYSGQIDLEKGQYQDAVNSFNIAIQEAPLNPLPLYLRSLSYTLLGQYQAALSDINAGLNDRPNDPLFSMAKANVLFVTGNYAAAIAICNQVIVSDSSAAPAYLIRGNSERMLGNATAANADYVIAAKLQSLE